MNFTGIIARVGQWATKNLPTILEFGKKARTLVEGAVTLGLALRNGYKTFFSEDSAPHKQPKQKTQRAERPDIISRTKHIPDIVISKLAEKIEANKKDLQTVNQSNTTEHKRLKLQIDMMELVVSSQTFDRFTNNIGLHAANLQIHMQTIQNTAGLVDAVNRQRHAIKAIIPTVNHLINVLHVGDTVRKIEGIDIDMRPDHISIKGAYAAFENTRELLLNEISLFTDAATEQLNRAEDIRAAAQIFPDKSAMVNAWLDKSVEPVLLDAKAQAQSLRADLLAIPKMGAELQKNLEHFKEDDM